MNRPSKKAAHRTLGDVGVAGYTLGGGLSFLSAEHVSFTLPLLQNFS